MQVKCKKKIKIIFFNKSVVGMEIITIFVGNN
jgi:hypothetical protein